jgi:hypothetical protein
VAIAEVAVLCDHRAVLAVGVIRKLAVAGSIAVWQAGGMDTVVIGFGEQVGQPQRELSIDQGISCCAERHDPVPASGQRRELQSGEQILAFEVWMIDANPLDRHTRSQELQKALDRVA